MHTTYLAPIDEEHREQASPRAGRCRRGSAATATPKIALDAAAECPLEDTGRNSVRPGRWPGGSRGRSSSQRTRPNRSWFAVIISRMWNSTRRFRARPSLVSLVSMGVSSPIARRHSSRSPGTPPFFFRYFFTDLARFSLKRLLYLAPARESCAPRFGLRIFCLLAQDIAYLIEQIEALAWRMRELPVAKKIFCLSSMRVSSDHDLLVEIRAAVLIGITVDVFCLVRAFVDGVHDAVAVVVGLRAAIDIFPAIRILAGTKRAAI